MSPEAYPRWWLTSNEEEQILMQFTFGLEDRTRPKLTFDQTGSCATILYNTMPTEALVKVVKFNRQVGDRNSIRLETTAIHTSYTHKKTLCNQTLNQLEENRCTHMWNQHGETRCVITVNNLEALISTSEFEKNQNSRQATRTRK